MRLNVQCQVHFCMLCGAQSILQVVENAESTTDIVLSLVLMIGALNLALEPSLTRMKKKD